ncbi:serine-tRNA(Ala) deacylase AlaX [Aureimonas endophytica]|uniref:Serine-tRNA(Ala) deacylase AlaX n=1 Tax=Aureimonas endophytica TaxID=2027858 RepID=A0A917E228_9HYPH|nr:alanyl-tRNA editing protein [Aureimonas endophytica]GGD91470.1 serine-tRNA(Ala) deacylase AlaX [Aureimonas endophytica]
MDTRQLYQDDAYLTATEAILLRIEGARGLVFDRTVFFAAGGGQPGDTGRIIWPGGALRVAESVYGADRSAILAPAEGDGPLPAPGETLRLELDWARRHKLMRMHTACHLLSVVCPFPVTGAAVGEEESRIDFDIPEAEADKAAVTERLMALVTADHPVFTRWITDAELDANPGLVESANVRPPRGSGRIRLVCIGTDGAIDTQPCGGTHVRSTGEIGDVHIGKIEKKGKSNRRFRIRFGRAPA